MSSVRCPRCNYLIKDVPTRVEVEKTEVLVPYVHPMWVADKDDDTIPLWSYFFIRR